MKKAIIITTVGEVSQIDLTTDALNKLQSAVGGLVQAIDINPKLTMWCNEEGKMIKLPCNPFGQALWQEVFGRTDYIVGDIVLTGGADNEGKTMGLSVKTMDKIGRLIKEVSDFI